MSLTVCIGHTNRLYENMASVAARSIARHTPDVNIRLVRCADAGHDRNMGTSTAITATRPSATTWPHGGRN